MIHALGKIKNVPKSCGLPFRLHWLCWSIVASEVRVQSPAGHQHLITSMSAPIYNPRLPYCEMIPGGPFLPGRMIRIQASCPPDAYRFAINLQVGPNVNPRDDIALHLNARFEENCIVRNSLIYQSWGDEERHPNFMPLQRGASFEILILCEPSEYKVAVNGQHFCEFRHRMAPQNATFLSMDGDMNVSLLAFEGGSAPMPTSSAYGAPQPGAYGAPQGPYGAPPSPYGAAPSPYGAPPGGYSPQPGYGPPPPPYGAANPAAAAAAAGCWARPAARWPACWARPASARPPRWSPATSRAGMATRALAGTVTRAPAAGTATRPPEATARRPTPRTASLRRTRRTRSPS